MSRVVRRVSDGEHLWGTVDVSPANRTVWSRTHVTVYAPGTNSAERRRLRLLHAWPLLGALLGLLLMSFLRGVPAWGGFGAGVVFYAAGFWPLLQSTQRLRRTSRHIRVSMVDLGDHYERIGDLHLLRACLTILTDMDEARRRGAISPVEFEAGWSRVYDDIPTSVDTSRSTDRREDHPAR
ncbi:hypothetical protein AX769_03510 [Frondihabitans sp. PAMC 28766]|uniref:DUF6611 family protein n=1 Tax=Frondihabitans sp. PAMC 28766 TaxID=1795630 RepID=UPI00078B78D9|nr:DUF6611 family protein [Frondihabitans sp. PAMC 28766]AMM19370.1 hypothetical protein AX769_03510 [Frondihabitans sp. PAMC 28766]